MKDKSFRGLMIVAVIAIIATIGVGFAAFSQSLTISGAGKVKASSWDIHFDNLSSVTKVGTAVEETAPTIDSNATHIGNFDVTFSTPGDSVAYTFDVVNAGTFNAEISSVTVSNPTCTGTGANADTDKNNVCNHLHYTLTYADGTAVNNGDTLNKDETKSMKLKLEYDDTVTADALPTNDVEISNLDVTVIYSQV